MACLWHYDHGAHHVMFFMFQNMAVPYIVTPARPCVERRSGWNIEFHDDLRHLSRVHSDGFLPAHLVKIGWARGPVEARRAVVVLRVERLTLQHLNVDQVEMYRMGITSQIEDAPDFRAPSSWCLRSGIQKIPAEPVPR